MDLLNEIASMSSNAALEIAKIEQRALDCVTGNLSNAAESALGLNNQITGCL